MKRLRANARPIRRQWRRALVSRRAGPPLAAAGVFAGVFAGAFAAAVAASAVVAGRPPPPGHPDPAQASRQASRAGALPNVMESLCLTEPPKRI